MPVTPPVIGEDIKQYARELNLFLQRNLGKLFFKSSGDIPAENGIFLWDDANNYPVVSSNGAFRQVAMKQATPSSSVGSAGDVQGMVAWDSSYIYICTGSHNGSSAIWKRIALTTY